jgi:hypothetical protein
VEASKNFDAIALRLNPNKRPVWSAFSLSAPRQLRLDDVEYAERTLNDLKDRRPIKAPKKAGKA